MRIYEVGGMEEGQKDMTANIFSSFQAGHKAVWAFL